MENLAKLIPELKVQNIKKSIDFYMSLAGFEIVYERQEDKFALLDKEGSRIMLEAFDSHSRAWVTGELEPPFGRGVNFQIEVADIQSLYDNFKTNNYRLFLDLEDKWYRADDHEVGNRQFLVQDPDGYLLRFFQDLGRRSRSVDLM